MKQVPLTIPAMLYGDYITPEVMTKQVGKKVRVVSPDGLLGMARIVTVSFKREDDIHKQMYEITLEMDNETEKKVLTGVKWAISYSGQTGEFT